MRNNRHLFGIDKKPTQEEYDQEIEIRKRVNENYKEILKKQETEKAEAKEKEPTKEINQEVLWLVRSRAKLKRQWMDYTDRKNEQKIFPKFGVKALKECFGKHHYSDIRETARINVEIGHTRER